MHLTLPSHSQFFQRNAHKLLRLNALRMYSSKVSFFDVIFIQFNLKQW